MSIREMIVPKSFDAQRTNAKIASGAKLTMRRRRSSICSCAGWPNLIQCSIFFSCHVSSTWVRSGFNAVADARRELADRSEESRGGTECVGTCRSRGSPYILEKNNMTYFDYLKCYTIWYIIQT